jgi:transposase
MLKMNKVETIYHLYNVENKSLREIVDITGHAFETVQKYAYMKDFNIETPIIQTREGKLDSFKKLIDHWLEEDLKVHKKQRHTSKKIHERLTTLYPEEFNVSSRCIRKYVAQKKKDLKEYNKCYIPLEHPSGTAQADFGEVYFIENGVKQKGFSLNLSFPYSNAGFCQLFKSQNQECLLQGLKNIFEHIGGVAICITFDNPSTIVIKIKEHGNRELTDIFINFKLHYGFKSNFCNPNSGHEKGSVENKVGYLRRNMLVPIPEFKDINEFNRELLEKCSQDMNRIHYKKNKLISELFNEDIMSLKQLPDKSFDVFKLQKATADKYGKIKYDKKLYSTAPAFAQQELWIKVKANEIEILDNKYSLIQKHKRLYGEQAESMNWLPYIELMAKRPNSFIFTGFFKELPQTVQTYFEQLEYQEKKTALNMLNRMVTDTDIDTAITVFALALEEGFKDNDSIWSMYYTLTNQPVMAKDLEITNPKVPNIVPFNINMKKYDLLMRRAGGEKVCNSQ